MESGGFEHVVSSVVERLSDLLIEKGKLLSTRENDNAWRIVVEQERIKIYVGDAEAIPLAEPKIRQLLADIKETAEDARDVLESHIRKVRAWGWIGRVRRNAFNNIPIMRKRAGLKAKDIEDSISEITNRLSDYGIITKDFCAANCFSYEAKGLNEDESWDLFKRKVLHERGT
ncbi:hypothetical protein LguiA_001393 [Lonicera macranthoides]